MIVGDFNIRVGEQDDHIVGVDKIAPRDRVDYKTSQYSDVFLDFLLSANLCILNGLNFTENNFTSISQRGCAVVDYCIVQYEELDRFSDSSVERATKLISEAVNGNISRLY